jgi:hypothetical protein
MIGVRKARHSRSMRTYKSSSTDGEGAGTATLSAVGSGQDSVGIEESASTVRVTVVGDADDEREVTSTGLSATDNVGNSNVLRRGGDKRSNKCNEGSDLDHCDGVSEGVLE